MTDGLSSPHTSVLPAQPHRVVLMCSKYQTCPFIKMIQGGIFAVEIILTLHICDGRDLIRYWPLSSLEYVGNVEQLSPGP